MVSIFNDGHSKEGLLYKYKRNLIGGFSWEKQYFRLDVASNILYQYNLEGRPSRGEEPKCLLVG